MTRTGDPETDDEGEESTLLKMLKRNPRLRKVFRRLIHDEQTSEKQVGDETPRVSGRAVDKSPSVDTIYVPALNKVDQATLNRSPVLRNHVNKSTNVDMEPTNNISQF